MIFLTTIWEDIFSVFFFPSASKKRILGQLCLKILGQPFVDPTLHQFELIGFWCFNLIVNISQHLPKGAVWTLRDGVFRHPLSSIQHHLEDQGIYSQPTIWGPMFWYSISSIKGPILIRLNKSLCLGLFFLDLFWYKCQADRSKWSYNVTPTNGRN